MIRPSTPRYSSCTVTLSEMPGFTTLVFSIQGCKVHCPDCHSKYLWDEEAGIPLTTKRFISAIEDCDGLINAVLFLGDIENSFRYTNIARDYNLTTGIYTGKGMEECYLYLEYFDYVKAGPYKKDLGGLESPTTNQRYIRTSDMKDLTYLFYMNEGDITC